jgi:acyl-CoA reductase-like NAD-dependent aldehyde dehydrogenase
VLVGGQAAPGFDEGYYVQPTAILAPNNHCSAARQEIFGPFATLMAFDTIDEALTLANDSEYGLASYVWSDHLPTVTHMSEGLRTGAVWVNTPMMRELRAPFGGFKNSGIGRQSGAACEAFFTEEKAITIPTKPHPLRRLGG